MPDGQEIAQPPVTSLEFLQDLREKLARAGIEFHGPSQEGPVTGRIDIEKMLGPTVSPQPTTESSDVFRYLVKSVLPLGKDPEKKIGEAGVRIGIVPWGFGGPSPVAEEKQLLKLIRAGLSEQKVLETPEIQQILSLPIDKRHFEITMGTSGLNRVAPAERLYEPRMQFQPGETIGEALKRYHQAKAARLSTLKPAEPPPRPIAPPRPPAALPTVTSEPEGLPKPVRGNLGDYSATYAESDFGRQREMVVTDKAGNEVWRGDPFAREGVNPLAKDFELERSAKMVIDRHEAKIREAQAPKAEPEAVAEPKKEAPKAKPKQTDPWVTGPRIAGVDGSETTIVVQAKGGGQRRYKARYRFVDRSSLVPSHDPNTLFKNPEYPEGVQQRRYHDNKELQKGISDKTNNLDPSQVINDSPTAAPGPPGGSPDGKLLLGNSRLIAIARSYRAGRAGPYRQYQIERAGMYGADPAAVAKIPEPVLYRELTEPIETMEDARRMVSEFNKDFSAALSPGEQAVSAGADLTPETFNNIGLLQDRLGPEATLRDAMRAYPTEFMGMLVRDGIVSEAERAQFYDPKTLQLTEAAKKLVENSLFGSIIPDAKLLQDAPPGVLQKLSRSLTDLAYLKTRLDEWDVTPALQRALEIHRDAAKASQTVEDYLRTLHQFRGDEPVVNAMVRVLAKSPAEVRQAFKLFVEDSRPFPPGQRNLLGITPTQSFNMAFGSEFTEAQYEAEIGKVVQEAIDAAKQRSDQFRTRYGAEGGAKAAVPTEEGRGAPGGREPEKAPAEQPAAAAIEPKPEEARPVAAAESAPPVAKPPTVDELTQRLDVREMFKPKPAEPAAVSEATPNFDYHKDPTRWEKRGIGGPVAPTKQSLWSFTNEELQQAYDYEVAEKGSENVSRILLDTMLDRSKGAYLDTRGVSGVKTTTGEMVSRLGTAKALEPEKSAGHIRFEGDQEIFKNKAGHTYSAPVGSQINETTGYRVGAKPYTKAEVAKAPAKTPRIAPIGQLGSPEMRDLLVEAYKHRSELNTEELAQLNEARKFYNSVSDDKYGDYGDAWGSPDHEDHLLSLKQMLRRVGSRSATIEPKPQESIAVLPKTIDVEAVKPRLSLPESKATKPVAKPPEQTELTIPGLEEAEAEAARGRAKLEAEQAAAAARSPLGNVSEASGKIEESELFGRGESKGQSQMFGREGEPKPIAQPPSAESAAKRSGATLKLWKYNRVTGLWEYVRDTEPHNSETWLRVFQRDEPKESFLLSRKKPNVKPASE